MYNYDQCTACNFTIVFRITRYDQKLLQPENALGNLFLLTSFYLLSTLKITNFLFTLGEALEVYPFLRFYIENLS